MPLKIDTAEKGLRMVFKYYQELALRYLWSLGGEGANSREVWKQVNNGLAREQGRVSISRASIIKFLNEMVGEGVLKFTETMGKGGLCKIYSAMYGESSFKQCIVRHLMEKLLSCFQKETIMILKEMGWAPTGAGYEMQ